MSLTTFGSVTVVARLAVIKKLLNRLHSYTSYSYLVQGKRIELPELFPASRDAVLDYIL